MERPWERPRKQKGFSTAVERRYSTRDMSKPFTELRRSAVGCRTTTVNLTRYITGKMRINTVSTDRVTSTVRSIRRVPAWTSARKSNDTDSGKSATG
jgi:hypothetical protein